MGNMKQRLLALTLALSLPCSFLLAGCDEEGTGPGGDGGSGPAQSMQSAEENMDAGEEAALQAQWEICLSVNERISELLNWTLDYARSYAGSNQWNDLVVARAVCDTALNALDQLEIPAPVITDAQYSALMEQGIESDVVKLETDFLESTVEDAVNTMLAIQSQLYGDIYFKSGLQNFGTLMDLDREYRELHEDYMITTTNYLLLQMKDQSLWDELRDRYPELARRMPRWESDPQKLEMTGSGLLDGIEEVRTGLKECVGASEYTLYLLDEAVETGSLKNLIPEMNWPRGLKDVFPMPDWVTEQSVYVYGFRDGKELVPLEVGDRVRQEPELCLVTDYGLEKSAVEEYVVQLESQGFQPVTHWDQDSGTLTVVLRAGASELLVTWEQEKTVISLSDPVVDLMPWLYYIAMTTKV